MTRAPASAASAAVRSLDQSSDHNLVDQGKTPEEA